MASTPTIGVWRPARPGAILLIEDEPDLVEIVICVLEDEGYTVRAVSTLDDAFHALHEETFDLVLVDGLGGDQEQALVNSTAVLWAAGTTPVVLFTGHRRDRAAVRAAGFADVITKPFDLATLTERVRMLLSEQPASGIR